MKILVLNCGSSSLKFQLIEMTDESVIAKGIVEEIGAVSKTKYQAQKKNKIVLDDKIKDHEEGLKLVMNLLMDKENGVLGDIKEIVGIGHRVVHGGAKFDSSTLIDESVKDGIRECIPLSPLHNPANLQGIEVCEKLLPGIPQVAVFDTAHGANLSEDVYTYAIPKEWREKYGIRRYGFHGTSHAYVASVAAEYVGKPIEDLRIITCHLGSGNSISAIKGGKCVETSMGFTPLEGLVMSTRCGDIDPAIMPFISKHEGLTMQEIDTMLNKKSGILALRGVSDFRVIEDGALEGNPEDVLAQAIYQHRITKYIGAYMFYMGGVDVIIFTAGVGEHSPYVRKHILENKKEFGISIDDDKNEQDAFDVSADDSKVKVLVIPTNEELAIARDTNKILKK